MIQYHLGTTSEVILDIYSIRGKHIKMISHDEQSSGTHMIHWDGKDHFGNLVPSGIYIIKLKNANVEMTQKAIIIR